MIPLRESPSSRGLGRGPFKAETRVRIPVGTPASAHDYRRRLPRRSASREGGLSEVRFARATERYYVGLTTNVAARLGVHNSGGSLHTRDLRPWELVVAIEFTNEASAVAFEKYLKSGSGRTFAKRHSCDVQRVPSDHARSTDSHMN
jgi:putative endonuclease